MIQDRALRILIVVGLVLVDAILALTLLGWLIMGVGMSGGMMNGSSIPWGLTVGAGTLALLVLAAVVATLIWALRPPTGRHTGRPESLAAIRDSGLSA